MTSEIKAYCKNCNGKIFDRFCQNCGQKTSVARVTFKETFQDFASSTFSLDAPILTTLKLLISNPGKLFRNFLLGKRKTYYKPVSFFVLTTIIYLLIRSLIAFDPFQDTSVIAISDENTVQNLDLARNFMLLNIDKLLLVFVFTLGLFMKLFFYKKYAFAEFIAVSFYLVGIYTIIVTLNMFYIQYVDPEFQALSMIVMMVYFIFAMLSFFKGSRVWVLLKSLALFFFALVLYIIIAFGISYLIVTYKN